MRDSFMDTGHLTDDALIDVICENEDDDLRRLEIAEHLSFCDDCLLRYLTLLEETVLENHLQVSVLAPGRRRQKRIPFHSTHRWTVIAAAAAAACLTFVFWRTVSANLGIEASPSEKKSAFFREEMQTVQSFFQDGRREISDILDNTLRSVNDFFSLNGGAKNEKK